MSADAPVVPGKVVQLSRLVRRLTCPNPGMMTGPGTNTYIVAGKESPSAVVIDPGPDDAKHIARIARLGRAKPISTIVVTHTHPDHSPGVARLKEMTGATVVGYGPRDGFKPDVRARNRYVVPVEGFTLRAVHTPGHASNHLCWHLEEENLLFSGDHVMNGSTVVISPPDGDMAKYLNSLARVRKMQLAAIAPGHGALIADADAKLAEYINHRNNRELMVLGALVKRGQASPQELVADIYTDVAPFLHPVACFSVWAHLRKLRAEGFVTSRQPDDVSGRWRPNSRGLRRSE